MVLNGYVLFQVKYLLLNELHTPLSSEDIIIIDVLMLLLLHRLSCTDDVLLVHHEGFSRVFIQEVFASGIISLR